MSFSSPLHNPTSTSMSHLPSPPSKTPSTNATTHPFFTPRRTLGAIAQNVANSPRQLMSPEESPCGRKRRRLDTPRGVAGFGEREDVQGSPRPKKLARAGLEVVLPTPRTPIRPSASQRLLLREMGGPSRMAWNRPCVVDWKDDLMRFYSRPQDRQLMVGDGDSLHSHLPFSTSACNRNPLVAVGDESGFVQLVESAKDEEPGFGSVYLSFVAHDNAIFDMSWSHDDHHLATSSGDQTVRIFDVKQQSCLFVLKGHANSVKTASYNPWNPFVLASTSRDGTLNVWDIRISGKSIVEGTNTVTCLSPIRRIEAGASPSASITAGCWTSESRIAAASQSDSIIRIWETNTNYYRRRKPTPLATSPLPPRHNIPRNRQFGINSLVLNPDGQRLYALCKDNHIYTYATNNLAAGPLHAYSHPSLLNSSFYVRTAISRSGRYLAAGSSDSAPVLFSIEEKLFEKELYADYSTLSTAGPDGKRLKVGKGAHLVRGHTREVTDVTWTVNDDLVTISDDFVARCWRRGERGEEAEKIRDGGEDEGRRWGWGWAEL